MMSKGSRRQLLIGGTLAIAMVAVPANVGAEEKMQPGSAAPRFSATDTKGQLVSLDGFKGKIVVLEWTNHDCPYVGKHYSTNTMQQLQRDATAKGIVWLTIISSAPGQQGYVEGLEADRLTTLRQAAPSAVLLDINGKVGRLYGATTTPHMFVINKDGRLAYMGGIDDKPSAARDTIKTARPFVREAIDALLAGRSVKAASTRPYGCSVKYSNS